MRIRILSDLHLMINQLNGRVAGIKLSKVFNERADVCVIAGDLCELRRYKETIGPFLKNLIRQHRAVIYVPGNHEYYAAKYENYRPSPSDFKKIRQSLYMPKNVFFMNNESMEIDGVKIVASTLWSAIHDRKVVQMLNDFNYVKDMTFDYFLSLHREAVDFLEREVSERSVVVTHHAPSLESISARFKTHPANQCYYTNMEGFVSERKPSLWIHGHSHSSCDYMIGETRVVANPMGYGYENFNFTWNKIVEI